MTWKVGDKGEVFLFSGGLDSLIGALYTGCERLLYVRLGHRYQFWEERAAKRVADELGLWVEVVNGPEMTGYEQPDAFIPGRNLILAFMGVVEHNRVWLALQKGETGLADRNEVFCRHVTHVFSRLFGRHVVVDSPFWGMDKQDMVAWYLGKGYPVEWLRLSRSCYSTQERECGDCPACFRKFVALEFNGVDTNGWFSVSPIWSDTAKDYEARLTEYPSHRQEAMRRVMGW
jgi:7-cyano-7-deazaguanine synthase in queuosine biosynthesis